MVEILVALALCTILIIPIASSLISSIKQTSSGKELQARNDFAQNMIEYVKSDSLDNIQTKKYFEDAGSYDVTFTPTLNNLKVSGTVQNPDTLADETREAAYEEYQIAGSVNLGTEHTKYSYVMQISNKSYAEKEVTEWSYVNPNNLALGVVEDIDYTKVALINGTIANYDTAVTNAFTTRKLQILKKKDSATFEQVSGQTGSYNPFANDRVERRIIVEVSDNIVGGKVQDYTVTCRLYYKDDSQMTFKSSGGSMKSALEDAGLNVIEYVPYSCNFEKLPNIYLMYNVCVYNGIYSPKDYILFDLSGLSSDMAVNAFVIETAETYSDNMNNLKNNLDSLNLSEKEKKSLEKALDNNILYDNKSIQNASDKRDDVEIYVAAKASNLSNLSVYHNFSVGASGKTNSKIHYTSDVDFGSYGGVYSALSNFKTLQEAVQEERGLYDVKLWMVKGDIGDVDTSKDPILTGTKGGSES